MENRLLYHLVRNAGRLMPCQALLDRVWGEEYDATEHYLRVFISCLRSKLENGGGPAYIVTERGVGYRFIIPTKDRKPAPSKTGRTRARRNQSP